MPRRAAVVALLVARSHAHGSVWSPEPRNSEEGLGYVPYGVTLAAASGGERVAMTVHNQHLCDPAAGAQTETYPADACVPNAKNARRPSYVFATGADPPSPHGIVVDCTGSNNCSAPAAGDGARAAAPAGPFAWIVEYPADSECATAPSKTYKLNQHACTQLPVTGDDYWTVRARCRRAPVPNPSRSARARARSPRSRAPL